MRSDSVNVGGRVVSPSEAGTQAAKEADRISSRQYNYGGGGGGGGGCFPRGTRISTPSGERDIAELRAGSVVTSIDPNTGSKTSRRVLKVASYPSRRIWRIRFEDGHEVRTTSSHTFRANHTWTTAASLRAGDAVYGVDGSGPSEPRTVVESGFVDETADVFNLIVKGENNFVADGTLVHSFTHFRVVRGLLWNFRGMIKKGQGSIHDSIQPASVPQ